MNRIFTPIIHLALAGIVSGGTISQAQQNSPTAKPVPITQIKIDSIEFQEAELSMVLDFLGSKARELNGTPANSLLYDPLGELMATNKPEPISESKKTSSPSSTVHSQSRRLNDVRIRPLPYLRN